MAGAEVLRWRPGWHTGAATVTYINNSPAAAAASGGKIRDGRPAESSAPFHILHRRYKYISMVGEERLHVWSLCELQKLAT